MGKAIGIFNGNSSHARASRLDDLGDDYTPQDVEQACEALRKAGISPLTIGKGLPTVQWRALVIAEADKLFDGDKRLIQAAGGKNHE